MPKRSSSSQPPASRIPPRYPFNGWPHHRYDEHFGYAWYVEPGTLVTQAHVPRATARAATHLMNVIDEVLRAQRHVLQGLGGITIIHDWRSLRDYDSEARRTILTRMRQREPSYLKKTLICLQPSPLLRMAVETANLFAAVALRATVEVVEDIEQTLRDCNVGAPALNSQFPESA